MTGLEYGVEKRIRVKEVWDSDRIRVFALAEDSETPFVIIREYDGDKIETEIWLEDMTAEVLIKQIQKALDILPTSK